MRITITIVAIIGALVIAAVAMAPFSASTPALGGVFTDTPTPSPSESPTPSPLPSASPSATPTVTPAALPSNIGIVSLNCNGTPESVVIRNSGAGAQPLTGWRLESQAPTNDQIFDLGPVGTLDPNEQITVYTGSGAPAPNPAAGIFVWQPQEVYRNNDPSDFARIINAQGTVVSQVNCGQTAAPTTSPGVTPAAVPGTGGSPNNGGSEPVVILALFTLSAAVLAAVGIKQRVRCTP